jgi:putative two-component system response regulator
MSEDIAGKRVLIVDDISQNIKVLGEALRGEYIISFAKDGRRAIELARSDTPPDLILLDIMMPDMDGYEVCSELKNHPDTRDIPIIFITAKSDVEDETKGFGFGAVDYITKPINPTIVQARVRTHIELKLHRDNLEDLIRHRTRELEDTRLEIIYRLARAAEFRDNETGQHVRRLSHYCSLLAQAAGLSKERCELIFHASSMHDVGKIGIPDNILQKPGKLDPGERQIMENHARIGADLLSGHDSELLQLASIIALTHHERWDGSGYPQGLLGDEIPIEGRITALCDVFDALINDRPYKKAWQDQEAIDEIRRQRGTHFDPQITDLFIDNLPKIFLVRKEFSG